MFPTLMAHGCTNVREIVSRKVYNMWNDLESNSRSFIGRTGGAISIAMTRIRVNRPYKLVITCISRHRTVSKLSPVVYGIKRPCLLEYNLSFVNWYTIDVCSVIRSKDRMGQNLHRDCIETWWYKEGYCWRQFDCPIIQCSIIIVFAVAHGGHPNHIHHLSEFPVLPLRGQ